MNAAKRKYLTFIFTFLFTSTIYSQTTKIADHTSGFIPVKQGKLFYQTFGKGDPILVLHGGPGLDQTYLQPQMLELAKDHQIIFYDQRGSGKSLLTPMNEEYININQFVEDLEALRKELALEHFILLGHSWGGFLAMNYSLHYPEHINGLILMDSAPADFKGQQEFLTEFSKRIEPIKNEIAPLLNYEKFKLLNAEEITRLYRIEFTVYFYDPKKVSQLNLDINDQSAQSGGQVMNLMLKTSWMKPNINLFPELRKLKIPTLIIHGKHDIVPIQTAKEIKEAIPKAQLVILDQCNHFPYIEQPEKLFKLINNFTKKRKRGIEY